MALRRCQGGMSVLLGYCNEACACIAGCQMASSEVVTIYFEVYYRNRHDVVFRKDR